MMGGSRVTKGFGRLAIAVGGLTTAVAAFFSALALYNLAFGGNVEGHFAIALLWFVSGLIVSALVLLIGWVVAGFF